MAGETLRGGGSERWRMFVAIELAGSARPAVEHYLGGLRASALDVAWTRPENLHLTLKFLGAVDPHGVDPLVGRLRAVAAAQRPFVLSVAGFGAFPSFTRPRVLWVGVAAPELAAVARVVDRACAESGFAPETRPFQAHVTLGRVRERERGRRHGRGARGDSAHRAGDVLAERAGDRDRVFGESTAEAIVLFRSFLGPQGARHEPVRVLPFTGR